MLNRDRDQDYYKTKKGIHAMISGRSVLRGRRTADDEDYVVELIRLNPRIFAFA
jgi:hypothetical protein